MTVNYHHRRQFVKVYRLFGLVGPVSRLFAFLSFFLKAYEAVAFFPIFFFISLSSTLTLLSLFNLIFNFLTEQGKPTVACSSSIKFLFSVFNLFSTFLFFYIFSTWWFIFLLNKPAKPSVFFFSLLIWPYRSTKPQLFSLPITFLFLLILFVYFYFFFFINFFLCLCRQWCDSFNYHCRFLFIKDSKHIFPAGLIGLVSRRYLFLIYFYFLVFPLRLRNDNNTLIYFQLFYLFHNTFN